jgi:hypothetical protein
MKDPRTILFAAQRQHKVNVFDDEDDACKGCLFERERHSVCKLAGEEAKKRRLPDCDDGWIYIAVKTDPRQLDIFEPPEAAPGTAQDHKEK